MVLTFMQMTPNCMVIIHLPILLSWRLEFFELLTQFTSGCPQTGSLSTRARHNSFGLVRSTVFAKRDADRLFSLLPSLTELSSMRNLGFIIDQESNMKDRITKLCQSCYYQLRQKRTVRHLLTSSTIQRWFMPSSARESISPTAFSMGQVPTSLTVYNRLQFGMTFTGSRFLSVFDTSLTPSRATACYGGPCTEVPDRAICK